MAPNLLRSNQATKNITTIKVTQQIKNMLAGFKICDTDMPNKVEGQSMFMPSAPPVKPRAREAVR